VEATRTDVYVIQTWTASVNISNTVETSFSPDIVTDPAGIVHMAWWPQAGNFREIYYSSSNDWSGTLQNISNTPGANPGDSHSPSIAIGPDNLKHIAWTEYLGGGNDEIFYANSNDWAATQTNITITSSQSFAPSVAMDSNGVTHITWMERVAGIYKTFYANSSDWVATRTNISNTPAEAGSPDLAIDSNDIVHVVWGENIAGINWEIIYANSADWTATRTNISNTADRSYTEFDGPSVAIDSEDVLHVVWKEDVGGTNYEIYYAASTDWATTRSNISNSSDSSEYPQLAFGPTGKLHLAWQEDVAGTNLEIYYANAMDWTATKRNVSNTAAASIFPSIAVSATGIVHIAWQEFISGTDWQIYYSNSGG
jgi:hypothetical protein